MLYKGEMGLVPLSTPNDYIAWANFLSDIRRFFVERGFLEVNTPSLVEAGAFESSIDPLQVTWKNGRGELHTSPEIAMKEILSELKRPIFQICKCFRDDLESPHHSREFTMLEFYEPGRTYEDMKTLVKELVASISPAPDFEEHQVKDLFKKAVGKDLKSIKGKNWEDNFFIDWLEKVEPSLSPKIPTLVTDYPLAVSPLSKQIDNFFAERFELYWYGMEICNGCTELSDSDELKRRHEQESQKRRDEGKAPHPFSERLYQATSKIGPAAGVAVGLDRLFLCISTAVLDNDVSGKKIT